MYKHFDIIRTPFPFADKDKFKTRPAVILARSNSGLYICCMVTSGLKSNYEHDFEVVNNEACGLPKKSKIRVEKIFTIDERLILSREGALTGKDKVNLKEKMKKLFNYL